jgi:hypothetical protein
MWNALPIESRASLTKNNITKKPYTKIHTGKCGIWLSRIRMGLSGLNAHRFTYNMIASPVCLLCKNESESTLYYLWSCTVHTQARNNMMERLEAETDLGHIDTNNIIQLLIRGETNNENHKIIYDIVTEYITITDRFK